MDEATRFYAGAMRTSAETLQLVCQSLDDETTAAISNALRSGYRLVMLSDPTGIAIVLFNARTGQIGELVASIDGRSGRERVYPLRRAPEANGQKPARALCPRDAGNV